MNGFGNINIFCVQDRTGTVTQFSPSGDPVNPVEIGDTGTYTGTQSWNGQTVTLDFTVNQLVGNNDNGDFGVTTAIGPFDPNGNGSGPGNVLASGWPDSGTVTWTSGANAETSPNTLDIYFTTPANAYVTTDWLSQYNLSRGTFVYATSPDDQVQQAIVQATDYLDQRYRYKGIKLLQFFTEPNFDPMIAYIDPWLLPFAMSDNAAYWMPSTTQQHTEWPRQGSVDFNGDSVYGIPIAVKSACAELALRALNGVTLQADYDSNVVANGAIVSELEQVVGPIRQTTTYDTKLGIGFFPDFPHVTRLLSKAGLLVPSGGRTIMR